MFLEKYNSLVDKIISENQEDAKEIIDFLDERVLYMPKYISALSAHVIGSKSAGKLMRSGYIPIEEYQHRITKLDSERTSAHNMALTAMDQINRQCEIYGLAHICPDDPDRYTRANFAAAVTMECFMSDHNHNQESIQEIYAMVSEGRDITGELDLENTHILMRKPRTEPSEYDR